MFRTLKQHWLHLKRGRPGRRFRDYYERRKQQQRRITWLGATIMVAASLLLILAGLCMIITPGPGWLTVILGLALLAALYRPAARVLDWAERKVLRGWTVAKRWWARPALRCALGTALVLTVVIAGCVWAIARSLD